MGTIFGDKVTAGGITFNDPAAPDGAVLWRIDELSGWDSTADIEFNTTAVGGGIDGEIPTDDAPMRARHLLLSGYVWAASREEAETLKDVLWRDAFPRNTDIVLTRYEPVPKFLTLRVSSIREFVMVGPDMYRFIVPLVAGDPFKYGAVPLTGTTGAAGQSTGGRTYPKTYPFTYGNTVAGQGNAINLVNAGNTESLNISITLVGPLGAGSWRISNETTGNDITFDIDVASTDTLVIDFLNGIALLNNYPISGLITGDFWKLATGANIIKLFADYNIATSISIKAYSAWE